MIQDITGTLSPGGHPGSYNGQDAYNGMLIADDLLCRERATTSGTFTGEGGCIEHDARCPNIVSGGGITMNAVRRLTPEECELLQGFPKNWTNIGEWEDENGKKHQTTDSARYRALGNSICTPFWFWLMRRISAQYERPATLGSLFDGIGGFPYCWERCNGEGTAVWSSEIEPFCIAVTKKHFGEE